MTAETIPVWKNLSLLIPILLFVLLNHAVNLRRKNRSRQFLMPVFALVYCILAMLLLYRMSDQAGALFTQAEAEAQQITQNAEAGGAEAAGAAFLQSLMAQDRAYISYITVDVFFMAVYLILKGILINAVKPFMNPKHGFYRRGAGLFYEESEEDGIWYLKPAFEQTRIYLKVFYCAAVVLSCVLAVRTYAMVAEGTLAVMFYPVFVLILTGEFFFALNGLPNPAAAGDLEGEEETSGTVAQYALVRGVLRRLFGDKLLAEDSRPGRGLSGEQSPGDMLAELENSGRAAEEAYAAAMRARMTDGLKADHSALAAGDALLNGKSILFGNPFYRDLIPYVFYPMNRVLLQHRKVLVISGRHGQEKDLLKWVEEGFAAVNGMEGLWKTGILTDTAEDLDVGILPRSFVNNLSVQKVNEEFFSDCGFGVLTEPSKLVTTAQIGLHSIVCALQDADGEMTWCAFDRNCDGLVDALSHILMTEFTLVSATEHSSGASTAMCWIGDGDHLQHRMLSNLTRYLGFGTELAFAALRNQISEVTWYGGDAFPVADIGWISKQYYYDLLKYASLPTEQSVMDTHFHLAPDLWSAGKRKNGFLVVEDESRNMFEIRREFATRMTEQGFINIISPSYLLADYMAANESIFSADPKAIPEIVGDYERTERNVALRLCVRMAAGPVPETEIRRELLLEGADLRSADTKELIEVFWRMVCLCFQSTAGEDGKGHTVRKDETGAYFFEAVNSLTGSKERFTSRIIEKKRRFRMKTGVTENLFFIRDQKFIRILERDLRNAPYIAEDEEEGKRFLGAELTGHIYQKYLPGQFFTFSGKYYEMLRVTADGQVLLRRAADHITGRPAYRQIRQYTLEHLTDAEEIGARRNVGGMDIALMQADIHVKTPAYWDMRVGHDFESARSVEISGIPERIYNNKTLLRIGLPGMSGGKKPAPEECHTLAVLFNELFQTLFAENASYIAVVSGAEGIVPRPETYSVSAGSGTSLDPESLYIIEDSQLDIGLLTAVQRNLDRIFRIICDYLRWNAEEIEESTRPAPEIPAQEYRLTPEEQQRQVEEEQQEKQEKQKQSLRAKIKAFFGRLFHRKKKEQDPAEEAGEGPETGEGPDKAGDGTSAAGDSETAEKIRETTEKTDLGENTSKDASDTTGDKTVIEKAAAGRETAVTQGTVIPEESENSGSAGNSRKTEEDSAELFHRKPYHERYYLLYGGTEVPEGLDPDGTLDYLEKAGFGKGELADARNGKNLSDLIDMDIRGGMPGQHFCDFCGRPILGTEYEVLADGRERCVECGRSAVKTEREFRRIFTDVKANMEAFYRIRITAPVHVKMVNAQKLHESIGQTFVPTGNMDARVLGAAVRSGNDFTILVENGAPRLQSAMTICHELTHIWQYANWNEEQISSLYGKDRVTEMYEGMAKWAEIQYAYLIGEENGAKLEELTTLARTDEYGSGFKMYVDRYPLVKAGSILRGTPFDDPKTPL